VIPGGGGKARQQADIADIIALGRVVIAEVQHGRDQGDAIDRDIVIAAFQLVQQRADTQRAIAFAQEVFR
jgi:hypothetical protein